MWCVSALYQINQYLTAYHIQDKKPKPRSISLGQRGGVVALVGIGRKQGRDVRSPSATDSAVIKPPSKIGSERAPAGPRESLVPCQAMSLSSSGQSAAGHCQPVCYSGPAAPVSSKHGGRGSSYRVYLPTYLFIYYSADEIIRPLHRATLPPPLICLANKTDVIR